MPSGHAVRLLVEACAGVEAAHAMGVIHRDIKPSNFFVTDEGALKVMDFGIAKATTVDDGGLKTRAGSVLGTPQYMSPEQASDSAQVTAATDIYALGVVAFELLTRTRPFDGGGIVNILLAHVNKPPPEPRSRNPAIPPGLEAVVLRCLEKRPEDRYASCRALAAALAPFQSEG